MLMVNGRRGLRRALLMLMGVIRCDWSASSLRQARDHADGTTRCSDCAG